MQFSQTSNNSPLYLASGSGSPVSGTLLYLLPQNTANPPATLSFSDSWNAYAGTYIFLEQPLAMSDTAFAGAVWTFLAGTRQQGVRFAWINTPNGTNPLTGTVIAVYQPSGSTYATGYSVTFAFQSVSLYMAARTALTVDETNCSFTFTQSGAPAIYLSAQFGKVRISGGNSGITSNMTLPLTGNPAGCFQFRLQLTPQNMTDLDVGLRYFYAVPPEGGAGVATQSGAFNLASLRYPIFNQGLTLYANLDPLGPFNPARSFFAFSAADAGQTVSGAAAAIPAFFNATMGDAFTLQPLTGSAAPTAFAALIFAVNQQASSPSVRDPLYLVPRGDFALQTARTGTVDLMCGLSGVEYIELGESANVISFFPGNNAFAEGYFPGQKPGFTNLQPTVAPTTSFAAVTQTAGAIDYYAQPDQSVLYNYNSQKVSGVTIPALAAVPVLAGTISQPPAPSLVYPLLPYSGLNGLKSDLLAAYRQLESQVISPERRTALLAAPPVAQQGRSLPSTYSATPQGLLATYSPSSPTVWDQIILAKMQATPAQFLLSNVQGNLLSAFQSNKLFLVISNPAAIQPSLFGANAQISIGDDPSELWNFNLDPTLNPQTGQSPWETFGTIFIVKYSDLSISDLAGQTSTWAFADEFNDSPATVSQTIADIISAAAESNDPDFAAFLNAVNNPNWNGILALNAMAPLSSLPPQLAGLAAGIDPDLFFAHHIGINTSRINVPESEEELSIADSSIFGLINYQAPGSLAVGITNYQFQVETLKVLFLNSAVANFSSIIDLQINSLFGEAAKLQDSTDNVVRMYGVYQQQVVNGQTLDSYVFQTASGQTSVFNLKSNVFNAVQINQGQFVTLTAQSTETSTLSQFIFWGLLDFKALPNFDVFSFGREDGSNTPAGLSYGDLIIEMSDDPRANPPVPQFSFDASQLSFDPAGSAARRNSFFNHFPLTVAGFTQGTQGSAPTGQGFMGVQTPLNQSALSYPWYSLNFNLNLGTPGALAAQVGFIATLTAAWSPSEAGSTSYSVFVGLKLPGSSGAKREITIEGIFDITFKTLEIIALTDSNQFILVLYNIGFKFLKFTFPPSGQINFVLFGDPDAATTSNTSLGWYVAYAKPDSKSGGGKSDSNTTANSMRAAKPAQLAAAAAIDKDK